MSIRAIALLVLCPAVLALPGRPKIVQLKDGSKVIGRVVEKECTEEVLVLRELRTKAKRKVPWGDIEAGLAQQLKVELGFAVETGAPGGMTTQGHEVRNRAGSSFTGLLVNEKTYKRDGVYILKTSEGERRIRLSDARSVTPVEIDLREVYTARELYERELKKKKPETAEDHYRLAEHARVVGAIAESKLHFEKVLELDDKTSPKYKRDVIERQLARVNKLLESRDALNQLKDVKRAIVYKQFNKARELLEAFQKANEGDEDLLAAATELKTELEEKRTKHYVSVVPRMFRDSIREFLGRKVKQKGITLRDAQQYALPKGRRRDVLKNTGGGGTSLISTSVTQDVVAKISEKLAIEPDEVIKFWDMRKKRSPSSAFYRDGTFIVVEDLEDAMQSAPKIKPKLGSSAPKPPKPKKQKSPDEWWTSKQKSRKHTQMRDWLFAFWAENSGFCDVLDPKEETCQSCLGKGYTQHMLQGPQGAIPFFDRCQSCHMAKHWRVVRFR